MNETGQEILDVVFQKYIKAGHPETPLSELEILASDEAFHVRLHVAENSNSSPEILAKLAKDVHPDVRMAVAEHPLLAAEALDALTMDECVDVRYAIAENANLPPQVITKLIEDENPYVKARALSTLRRIKPSAIRKLIPKADNSQIELRRQALL